MILADTILRSGKCTLYKCFTVTSNFKNTHAGVDSNIIEDNEEADDSGPAPDTRPELRSNIMNMLSASENTMSAATSIASVGVPDTKQSSPGSGADEHSESESGSGSDLASGEDSGSAEPSDENTPNVNTKRKED